VADAPDRERATHLDDPAPGDRQLAFTGMTFGAAPLIADPGVFA
jgi:hypothetical protein